MAVGRSIALSIEFDLTIIQIYSLHTYRFRDYDLIYNFLFTQEREKGKGQDLMWFPEKSNRQRVNEPTTC